ncbi:MULTISPECIES: glycoside hydrolase family 130 protein [Fulvivirga]|uniref:Glycoside hydrolase family 130 protein n=1 Tax=Fulvivirga sediminis TaxID=2803949 RepID=A0A937F6A1_9BACT|nr:MULTISPECIES: glycoside hydrolase family 130 protein [Fulvivirga]MBL3657171.1 glycoside hydrolase family 130 protein [Fulvivirga sediminis]UII27604.1 glycoside hydrolase family 130 protein [Fulvivirga maritima]
MRVSVIRKNIKFMPDPSRVVARYFMNGDERTIKLINNIMIMSDTEVYFILEQTLREFASRHRNISKVFFKHCHNLKGLIEHMGISFNELSDERKMLIGSYTTMEYSIESAAFFNPSMVEDFDQSYLNDGEKRVIISFRATGEGHLSSIVFRRGILDKNNDLQIMKTGSHIDKAEIIHKKLYNKKRFIRKLEEMQIPYRYSKSIMQDLPDRFEYFALHEAVSKLLKDHELSTDRRLALQEVTWLADSFYDVQFTHDSDITERVIFPLSMAESKGIEDARFVKFTDDDNSEKVYATYTAYNGHTILPKLLSTEDFYTFRVMPLHGDGAQNKNLAMFPRKIKGKFVMLARIDGVNNYLMYSDRSTVWNDPIIIQSPKFPWEFTQMGNCGSPIYTKEGWLVISHGVGPMRRYCIGASLFDLDDPSKEIGRLKEPLLSPNEDEREGYVPNVVYSCGSLIHNNNLILPYAVSDYSSTYGVVDMEELLTVLKS